MSSSDPIADAITTRRRRLVLDLEALEVDTFDVGRRAVWGNCTNPRCTAWDLLDEDGACTGCVFVPSRTCPKGACDGR